MPTLGRLPALLLSPVALRHQLGDPQFRRFLLQVRFGERLDRLKPGQQAVANADLNRGFILLELRQFLLPLGEVAFELRGPFALGGEPFLDLGEFHPRLGRFLLLLLADDRDFAGNFVRLFGAGLHLLGQRFAFLGLLLRRDQAQFFGGNFLLEAVDLAAAERHFLVQASAFFAMLADAGAHFAGLIHQIGDPLLQEENWFLHRFDLIALGGVLLLGVDDHQVDIDRLLPQFAEFAFSRQDAAFGVVGADGECAIRLQEFAVIRDKAQTRGTGTRRQFARGRQVRYDANVRQQLRRQAGQFGRFTADENVGSLAFVARCGRIIGNGIDRLNRHEADAAGEWLTTYFERLIQPGRIAHQETLGRFAQRQIDERSQLARDRETVGDQADDETPILAVACVIQVARIVNQFENLADAGAQAFLAAFELLKQFDAAGQSAALDFQVREPLLGVVDLSSQSVALVFLLPKFGAGVGQQVLNLGLGLPQVLQFLIERFEHAGRLGAAGT